MLTTTATGSKLPARLAYAAALIFTAASGATNLLYGWDKGTDFGSSLVWATVSLGVSIVFSLSWPALIRATDQTQHVRAFIILVGLLLTGTYSVSAALGSAYGGRVQAANVQTEKTDARTKADTAYKAAKAELDTLAAARFRDELNPQIRTLKATKGANNCDTRDGPISRKVCAEADELEAEAARADRRAKLAETMKEASKALEAIGPGTVANSDAIALTSYLTSMGVKADPEVINKLLVLLAVLVIECGGGVSFAIGMSLSAPAAKTHEVPGENGHVSAAVVSTRTEVSRTPSDTSAGHVPKPESDQSTRCPTEVSAVPRIPLDTSVQNASGVRLLDLIRDKGGVLIGGQRSIARTLGWSKSRLHEALHDLAHAGLVKLTTGKTGTVVQMLPIG